MTLDKSRKEELDQIFLQLKIAIETADFRSSNDFNRLTQTNQKIANKLNEISDEDSIKYLFEEKFQRHNLLSMLAIRDNIEIFQLLLNKILDKNLRNSMASDMIHLVCKNGCANILDYLLDLDPDIANHTLELKSKSNDDSLPLKLYPIDLALIACRDGRFSCHEAVKKLIRNSDLNHIIANDDRDNPLIYSLRINEPSLAKVMLENEQIDLKYKNHEDSDGYNAFYYAAFQSGSSDILKPKQNEHLEVARTIYNIATLRNLEVDFYKEYDFGRSEEIIQDSFSVSIPSSSPKVPQEHKLIDEQAKKDECEPASKKARY